MNFANVKSLTIPEGNVVKILEGSTVLWSKASPAPGIVLPPNNEIWYEATSQISSNIGSPVSHSYDSTTQRGVLVYRTDITSSLIVGSTALKSNAYLTKVWWPDCCQNWVGDCMHSCGNLQEIYAGSSFQAVSDGTCNGGTTPHSITLVNNNYFYENTTGLVLKSSDTLVLGTYYLDLRNTPCSIIGSRCMADENLNGATIYFPNTVTAFVGDYNISKRSGVSFTAYFYSTVAPTLSNKYNLFSTNTITVHIPVGSLSSYQDKWSTLLAFDKLNFIEDL